MRDRYLASRRRQSRPAIGSQAIAVFRAGNSGGYAHVGECAISFVAVKAVLAIRKPARATGYGHPHPAAICVLPGLGGFLQIEIKIVGDEQIEVAVPVVVEKSTSRAPAVPAGCRARRTESHR